MKDSLAHLAVRRVLPVVLMIGRSATPARRHVFLIGYPPTEGNAVETARALQSTYPGTIVWAQAPSRDYLDSVGIPDDGRIHLVSKARLSSLWKYVTAEAVFFTHGVYGDPPTSTRKPIINLWHGGGFKPHAKLFADRRLPSPAASHLVAGARLWGTYLAGLSGLDQQGVLLSGLPRCDQLRDPASSDQLAALGIDPQRPFVVWMPSYRRATASGTMTSFSDSADSTMDHDLATMMSDGARILSEKGIQLVVKPHPLDAVARHVEDALLIDDTSLSQQGLPLYRLLGAASGLITDVSSVMSDFLLLDRPIGFFFPDRDDYRAHRGIYPEDAFDWLPGPLLDHAEDFAHFAEDLCAGGTLSADRRRDAARRMGLVPLTTERFGLRLLRLLHEKDRSGFAASLQVEDD